jgi:predicted dehydrogenase
MGPLRIGVVGCGNICGTYFRNLARFRSTQVVACADLDAERARAAAAEHGFDAFAPDDLLRHPDVDLVLNLTIPNAHAAIAKAAIEAGKHVYNEKPLAIEREDAWRLLELARERGVLIGCAPDTFMGAGLQTCRRLIDGGAIGEPVAAHAFMLCHGHENWHPDPEFYYRRGGGPMFDMGVYYLTALVHLLGGIRRVAGSTRISFPERVITSEPKRGERIRPDVPTHVAAILDFESGPIAELTTSFDVWHSHVPSITVYGSEGSMMVPDPNGFGGEVYLRRRDEDDWRLVPHTHAWAENSRGLGVLDLAHALRTGRHPRASGDLAYHVLDVMHAVHESSEQGRHIQIDSHVPRPEAMMEEEFVEEL